MEESRLRSEETRSEETRSEETRSAGPVTSWEAELTSWEAELTSVQHSLKFVLKLKDEFVCPVCGGVVLNPQQNSCGHIYCLHCLQTLLDTSSSSSPVCPVDGAVITPAEVFQDNCCKREISTLQVFCTNSPECTAVVTLHHLQEHLRSCQFQQLQCTNPGCRAALQRRLLQEHLSEACPRRLEACPHCGQRQQLHVLQEHVQSSCPDVEVDCPNSCFHKVLRHKLAQHQESCPEVSVCCSYSKFGCSVQGKRGTVDVHQDAAVNHHMLLLLRSNEHLERQVEVLQQEVLLRQQEVQTDGSLLAGLQKKILPLLQQSDVQERHLSASQRTQSRQEDVLSTVLLDVQQVSRGLPGLEELDQLRQSLDAVTQEVTAAEELREHLGRVEDSVKDHSCLLDLHAAQLSCNQRRLQELEVTSHDGKLVWKIRDFGRRRDAEVRGQTPCLSSVPFHAGRCGYKMAAKAYLNGDGEGRGTHLSLYVVLMTGDFDALLPWPFTQTVSLCVLDQSGGSAHRSLSFRPDAAAKSFQQPDARAASNVAVGFSCFCPLHELQAYVRDDALFVRVKVDMSGLDL